MSEFVAGEMPDAESKANFNLSEIELKCYL